MTADELLQHLGQSMGMAQVRLDDFGCARLMFDGALAVNLEYDGERDALHLYSEVGRLPAQMREAFLMRLLQANLFCAHTLGATLAVDSLNEAVVLCRCVQPQQLTVALFADIVQDFVAAVEQWTQTLQTGLLNASQSGDPALEQGPGDAMSSHMLVRG